MQDELFRSEATDFNSKGRSQFGDAGIAFPVAWSVLTALLGVFILLLIMFLATMNFSRKETVRGVVRFDGAEARVYPQEAGHVQRVLVEQGMRVELGQALFVVSAERFLDGGESLTEGQLDALRKEASSLAKQAQSAKAAYAAQQTATRLALARIDGRTANAVEQVTSIKARLDIARGRVEQVEGLASRGLIAEPVLNERVEAVAALEQGRLEAEDRLSDAIAEKARLGADAQQARALYDRDAAQLQQRIIQVEAQIQGAASRSAYTVLAPQAGKVAAINVRAGEAALPNVPLAVILPEDARLIAELYVPSRAIGFVQEGQEVKLMYDAFPYQKFGVSGGAVDSVTLVAQRPEEIGFSSAGSPELVFRVNVMPDHQEVPVNGIGIPLQPGMSLSADIQLEERTLLDWLMAPLYSAR